MKRNLFWILCLILLFRVGACGDHAIAQPLHPPVGYEISKTAKANAVPLSDINGKISSGWLPVLPSTLLPLATDAETVTGTATGVVTTPANITARLAAPGTIGGFTTTGDANIGSTTAGKNLTVNATRTSIFTYDEANVNEDDATWTMTGTGALVHVTGNTTALTATTTEAIVAGTTYRVTIAGTGGGGTATYTLGGVTGTTIAASGAIAIEDFITASTTGAFIITPASGCTVSITSITIEKQPDATGDLTVDGNLSVRSPINFSTRAKSATYPLITASGGGTVYYDSLNSTWIFSNSVYSPNIVAQSNTGFIGIGTTSDIRFYRDAANILAFRNSTAQNKFRVANTWTDASNYEYAELTGVQGASINLTAATAGTGEDNLDIVLTPAGTGAVKCIGAITQKSGTVNTGGGLRQTLAEATSGALSGATGTISVNVPSGARIHGIQLRVDTAITADTGVSWSAVYVNTPTTAICSGKDFTRNTKFNAIHPAYEITTGTVTITVAPNAGNFTAGVIRAVVYYEDLVALSDNP